MELRLAVLAAFLVMAITCSEARHSIRRRGAEDQYDDPFLADEGGDEQNDAGTDEDEEIVPGRIVTNSSSYNVTPGRTVRLECKVVPENAMSTGVITWNKDDTAIFIGTMKLSPDSRLSLDDTNLLIHDVRASDCARYQCSFSQDVGSSNVTHILSVNEPPRIISFTATDNGSVPQGANLLLTCSVTGYPEPKIIWSVDRGQGNGLLKETDGEFTPNSVFIPNVTREHSGRYYCYSVNNLGNSTAEVVVNVIAPPRVHVKHPIKNSALRVPAELECSVHESYPVPHIRWYKDGVLVEESTSRYVVSTNGFKSNLTVTPEREEDFGTFTCAAESRHGTHNKSIDLVQDPVVTSLSSEGPSLSWSVDSHQPLETVELQVRSMDEDADFKLITVPLPQSPAHSYAFSQRLDKDLKPGRYEATVKVKNSHSWNKNVDPTFVEIIGFGPESITGASVYRGLGNNADSIQTTFVSTVLMYLLVRMM